MTDINSNTAPDVVTKVIEYHLDQMGNDKDRTELSLKFIGAALAAGCGSGVRVPEFTVNVTIEEARLIANAMALACALCQAGGKP